MVVWAIWAWVCWLLGVWLVMGLMEVEGDCSMSTIELSALQKFYEATNGDQWQYWIQTTVEQEWNFTQPSPNPCTQLWQGIACTDCNVSGLTVTKDPSTGISMNLVGYVPDIFDAFTSLTQLTISSNPDLSGMFPSSLLQLNYLNFLDLHGNALGSQLPTAFNFSTLFALDLSFNIFSGPLHQVQWNIPLIQTIYLSDNFFTGHLPLSMFDCRYLNTLSAANNYLDGPLPDLTTSATTALYNVYLSHNLLTGTLPVSWSGLTGLKIFDLSLNLLRGPIPSSWTTLQRLRTLQLSTNELTGQVPMGFATQKKLSFFLAFNNWLTGPMPAFGQSVQLQQLSVGNNYLTSTLPANLSRAGGLVVIDVHANLLHGPVPQRLLTRNGQMKLFYCHNNQLSSTLPSLAALTNMLQARFDTNQFTGSIPKGLQKMTFIRSLNFSYNNFQGSIAMSTFGNSSTLQVVDLSENYLTGTLDNCFNALPHLQILLLQNNFFRGDLKNVFDFNVQGNLTIFDVSANELTGSLPDSFFTDANFSVLVASTNCLAASLSDQLCSNQALQILALDGQQTADRCRHRIFPAIPQFTAYSLTNPMEGTIPACLFTMPRLSTLHLSGNSIFGRLPDLQAANLTIHESLTYLSLSHNQLTGSIPPIYLQHPFLSLDLSFNKLNGVVDIANVYNFSRESKAVTFGSSSSSSTYTLALNLNRLSGGVPSSWVDINRVRILEGNMFACPQGKLQLPQNDVDLSSYECGSQAVDVSLYAWVAGMIALTVFVGTIYVNAVYHHRNRSSGYLQRLHTFFLQLWSFLEHDVLSWWQVYTGYASAAFHKQSIDQIYEFGIVMKEIRRWIFAITVVIVCVFLPLYPLLRLYYGTYTYAYAWTVALAYLSGKIPAGLVMAFMLLFLVSVFSRLCSSLWVNVFHMYQRASTKTLKAARLNRKHQKKFQQDKEDVASTAEESAVDASDDEQTQPVVALVTSTVSKEKEKEESEVDCEKPTSEAVMDLQSSARALFRMAQVKSITLPQVTWLWYAIMFFSGLMNIAIVLTVNMSYVFATSTSLSAEAKQAISFLVCIYKIVWNGTVMGYLQSFLTRTMPIHAQSTNKAKEQHFEVVIVSFMLWMSMFNNILAPCISVAIVSGDCFYYAFFAAPTVSTSFQFLECDSYYFLNGKPVCTTVYTTGYLVNYVPPFTYNYQCTSSLLTNFMDVIIYRFIVQGIVMPLICIPVKILQERAFIRFGSKNMIGLLATYIVPEPLLALSTSTLQKRLEERQRIQSLSLSLSLSSSASSSAAAPELEPDELPEVHLRAKNEIIALISDIAVLLTFGGIFPPIAVIGCFAIFGHTIFTQLSLGRLVVLARSQSALAPAIEEINHICGGIRFLLAKSLLSLVLLLSIFWSLFLFDILGDAVGITRALWVFSIMAGVPGWIQLTNYLLRRFDPSSSPSLRDWRQDFEKETDDEVNALSTVSTTTLTKADAHMEVNIEMQPMEINKKEVLNVLHANDNQTS